MQYFFVSTSMSKIGKACSQSPRHEKKNQGKKVKSHSGTIALHNFSSFHCMKRLGVLQLLLDLECNVRTNGSACHSKKCNINKLINIISLRIFSQPHLTVVFNMRSLTRRRYQSKVYLELPADLRIIDWEQSPFLSLP